MELSHETRVSEPAVTVLDNSICPARIARSEAHYGGSPQAAAAILESGPGPAPASAGLVTSHWQAELESSL
jgi:hypothetical protein